MNVTIEISTQDIADLVVTAIEGGSNYWLNDFILEAPERKTLKETPWYSDPALYDGREFAIICKWEDGEKTITKKNFEDGLRLFAENSPRHFADFKNENFDATTADVFIQYVILGQVVYG